MAIPRSTLLVNLCQAPALVLQRHEPDDVKRRQGLMSLEGFVRFLTDRSNLACVSEHLTQCEQVRARLAPQL